MWNMQLSKHSYNVVLGRTALKYTLPNITCLLWLHSVYVYALLQRLMSRRRFILSNRWGFFAGRAVSDSEKTHESCPSPDHLGVIITREYSCVRLLRICEFLVFQVTHMFIMSFPKAITRQDVKHDLLGCKKKQKIINCWTGFQKKLDMKCVFPPVRARGEGQAQIRVWSIPAQPYFLRPPQVFSNDVQQNSDPFSQASCMFLYIPGLANTPC